MRKCERTEYGYISCRKRHQLLMTLLMVVIGIIIFILGCALNKGESTNVFTVAAILMVLPGAKFLVSFIVVFPYHTPDKKQYEELKSSLSVEGRVYSDLVITSTEKVMNLDFLIITEGCVLGVLGKKRQELSYIQKYLVQGVRNWAPDYRIKIYGEYQELLKAVRELKKREAVDTKVKEKELSDVEAYLKSLIA